jgi:ATP-dependent helicase YprA (DUF1998 family)
MDVFKLREQTIGEYAKYTKSFLQIRDQTIQKYVDEELAKGKLWPDSLVQLSPAYDTAENIDELVKYGVLDSACSAIFSTVRNGKREPIELYRHQRRALELAQQGKHFVVTTGTGSGKSLTYILPIVNYVLRNQPENGKVRAIIVYPMNALINSQAEALERYLTNKGISPEVRYARYTGQEKEDAKSLIQKDPPHILLTNYMMLELMLTRPEEHGFVDAGAADLQFVVLDELHTYRGRQGADVALLMRRLRERSGNDDLLFIGTSATMASGDEQQNTQVAVAQVASSIFGVEVPPEQVIEETLVRATMSFASSDSSRLVTALQNPLPSVLTWDEFLEHPIAQWIESTFSLSEYQGSLKRARPLKLKDGAERLAALSGVSVEICEEALQHFFKLGSQIRRPEGKPAFTFKLHQFISQGGSVYASLKPAQERYLTLEGQYTVEQNGEQTVLFPLVFCRECGQHYYLCSYDEQQGALFPRPSLHYDKGGKTLRDGYLLIDEDVWDSERNAEDLPDSWYEPKTYKIKKSFQEAVPRQLFVYADGKLEHGPQGNTTEAWFMPAPFLTCLQCGVMYTRREREFGKLAGLSSEGRSTATTLLSVAAINEMRNSDLGDASKKLLSFTDNRQDASLQAGHFNDFVQVALLRSAIYQAVKECDPSRPLDYRRIADAVFASLALDRSNYAEKSVTTTGAKRQVDEAFLKLLEYRTYEDLRRSWRITQPNLEQCGLLLIDYLDLEEVCNDDQYWQEHPLLAQASPQKREFIARTILEYMRRELAIDADCLNPDKQSPMLKEINGNLNAQWRFNEDERLREASIFYETSDDKKNYSRSLSARSTIGRFLRSAWSEEDRIAASLIDTKKNSSSLPISEQEYPHLLNALFKTLEGANLIINQGSEKTAGYQIRHTALLWRVNDGSPPIDHIRARYRLKNQVQARQINRFFRNFYMEAAANLRRLEAREHTGQVSQEHRQEREQRFRSGDLQVMYCSPTMELGIDISDLSMVHLRNVPPTPANYAQRSGRAGRSGQAALVMSYCATGSGHDQYFFQRPADMVAGVVAAPQIELANEDLLRAHIYATWMRFTELPNLHSILELLDITQENYPIRSEMQQFIELDARRMAMCKQSGQYILDACAEALRSAPWFTPTWLDETLHGAATAFDAAFDRWRTLYRAAEKEIRDMRQKIDSLAANSRSSARERNEAERREQEAKHQRNLLGNAKQKYQGDGDFYPYRYLASEGFLPGYNFPRLPVRAFLRTDYTGNNGLYISRPRFLAINEFGPQNVIYHEGRKYRITKCNLPTNSQQSFHEIKACQLCGYLAEKEDEICRHCGTHLTVNNRQQWSNVFEMPTMSSRSVERITSEEEERLREGFSISTHFRFGIRRVDACLEDSDGSKWLQLTYAPAANIYRINHGWKRLQNTGFRLNTVTGEWGHSPNQEDAPEDTNAMKNVRLIVQDTRNLLLIEVPSLGADSQELITLQYAIQRAIVEVFQLENQELLSDRINHRLLYWEAAEGGAGVLRRLVEEPDAMVRVARMALEICHFNPDTGEEHEAGECTHACYRCLLSYTNQPDHSRINRRLIRDLLVSMRTPSQLLETQTIPASASATQTSSASAPDDLQEVIDAIATTHARWPSKVYDGNGFHSLRYNSYLIVVPQDASDARAMHEYCEQRSDEGYIVTTLTLNQDLAEQIAKLRLE